MKKAAILALSFGLVALIAAPSQAAQPVKQQQSAPMAMEQQQQAIAPQFKLVKTFQGEDKLSIVRPTFSKSGQYLAANLTDSKIVRIWNTADEKQYFDIQPELLYGNDKLVDGLEFTPDEKHIIVFRAGQAVKEIDFRTQQVVRHFNLDLNAPQIEDYALSQDGKWLIVATANGVDIIDYLEGKKLHHILEGQTITSLDLSRDGKWLAFGRKGEAERCIGLIDMTNPEMPQYPLAKLTELQREQLPKTDVRHVSFDQDGQHLLVGYGLMPEAKMLPVAEMAQQPAEVILVDIHNGQFTGPKHLSNAVLGFDPVSLRMPFRSTLINTYEPAGVEKMGATVDILSPDLKTVKTVSQAQLDAPMMNFRISPDQKWMAGSFKEADGKVRVRLYQLTPETTSAKLH